MAYGRGKFLMSESVVSASPSPRINMVPAVRDFLALPSIEERRAAEQRELETLRAINAHLLRELAQLKQREAEALKLADRDGLTGLYNRRCTMEMLNNAIADALAQNLFVGVLFIDLNGFKAINDQYGHAAGDRILTTVATRISARVRVGDVVCRYGGDEFVVVLPLIPDVESARRVADTIRERVALPYWVNGREQHLSAAIGAAMFPHDGDDASSLIHAADQLMYRLKSRGERGPASNPHASFLAGLSRRRDDRSKERGGGAR
jgi:diguanylate cyclase (GGDEF)-like protein